MESVFVKMAFKRTFKGFAIQCPRSQDVETVPLHRSCEDMHRASFIWRRRGESEAAMQILLILTGVVAAAMLVYLTYVLLKGENL